MKRKTFLPKITIFTFLFSICGMLIMHILLPEKKFSVYENRYLKTISKIDIKQIFSKTYLNQLEDTFNDQLPLRDFLVSLKAIQDVALLQGKTNDVYFGKDNELIPHMPSFDETIYQRNIAYMNTFVQHIAIPCYLIAIPSKHTMLHEQLPNLHYDVDEISLWKTIQSKLTMTSIDLFSYFETLQREPLYYKTDHHLTALGSYYVYQAYLKQTEKPNLISLQPQLLRTDFQGSLYVKSKAFWYTGDDVYIYTNPDVSVEYEQDGNWTTSVYNWDNINKRDAYTFFLDGNHAVVKIRNEKAVKRHVLVLRDSFGQSFVPYLANDVSDITLLDLRYYKKSITEYCKDNNVDEVIFLYSMDSIINQKDILMLR